MKIAFIVGKFPSLSVTFILNQITGLIDRGHEVDIFAEETQDYHKVHPDIRKYNLLSRTYYRPRPPDNKLWRFIRAIGLIIANFHKNPLPILKSLNALKYGKDSLSLRLLYEIFPFLDKNFYDIIHCHFGPNGNLGVLLKDLRIIEGKIVTSFYGFDVSSYIKDNEDVYQDLFKKGDLFIALSNQMKKKLIDLGCTEKLVIKHPLGIDPQKFIFRKRKLKSENPIRILTIARLTEKKGLEYSIKAFAKATKRKIEYIIVGDGPLRDELENLISELQIKTKVILKGWKDRDEIRNLCDKSTIFMLASVTAESGDQEGTPTVLLEAMASGLPIISTLHAGIPEQVRNGKSGFLVPERDIDAIAERLNYLIEHPEIWQKMGKTGRKFIEENYNIDKLNDRLVGIYQNLLEGKLP